MHRALERALRVLAEISDCGVNYRHNQTGTVVCQPAIRCSCCTAATPDLYDATVGLMFAFSLKRFLGSYLFFNCTSRG